MSDVPAISGFGIEFIGEEKRKSFDFLVRMEVLGSLYTLAVGVSANGQPRQIQADLLFLKNYAEQRPVIPVLMAPYLSAEARMLCQECGVNFLDLEGNARLVFGAVFISRQVASKPKAERRELRSIFKPKSARVLRRMMQEPLRPWRVADLAHQSGVSLGHVSNVRTTLLNRGWAQVSDKGLILTGRDAMLDAWRDIHDISGKPQGFYTTLHGELLEKAIQKLPTAGPGRVMLGSFSAAQWLAPYGRTGTQYFYADEAGLEKMRSVLKLTAVGNGESVSVTILHEPDLFLDAVEPAPGIVCANPVQTYLDLYQSGERGREAAEYLRQKIWSD